MAPKSHPTCGFLKIRKMLFGASPLAPNEVRRVQAGSKNREKIDPKMRSRWEAISASIFYRFCWILGSKLGGKTEPKSIKKGIKKVMKIRRRPGGVLEASWRRLGASWRFMRVHACGTAVAHVWHGGGGAEGSY